MKTRTILGLLLIAGACFCISLYAAPPPMSGGGGASLTGCTNSAGDLTCTSFTGDGSGLTGVTATSDNDTKTTRVAAAEKANAASPVAGTTGVFSGTVTATAFLNTAPDGNHSIQAYNTTANPTCGSNPDMKGALASVGSTPVAQLCNGTDWVSLLTSGGALGTPASGTMTNVTGLPKISSTAYSAATSSEFATAISDKTGSGAVVLGTNPTLDGPIITSKEEDCHADGNLTAAQMASTIFTNYDQADGNATCILPTAARGMSSLFTVATARAKTYGVRAKVTDKIYLLAANGTISAGADHGAVVMVNAQVGQQFACYTFKTGATDYDWACKAIAIGTSTFEARPAP